MIRWLIGFRKLTIALIFMVVAITLLVLGLIPAEDWLKHTSTVCVAFFGTNVGEHVIDVMKDWIQGKKTENMNKLIEKVTK